MNIVYDFDLKYYVSKNLVLTFKIPFYSKCSLIVYLQYKYDFMIWVPLFSFAPGLISEVHKSDLSSWIFLKSSIVIRLCWLISSPAPWTVWGADPTVRSSDPTTSCSDRVEPETTGPRDITQKVGVKSPILPVYRIRFILDSRPYKIPAKKIVYHAIFFT